MLSRQEEDRDRREVLRNDLRVRQQEPRMFAQDQSLPNQATTFHQFAQADANVPRDRYAGVNAAHVVGSTPDIAGDYPAGSAWCADPGSQLVEPPLGYEIDRMPELEALSPASPSPQATGPTSDGDAHSPLLHLGEGQRADVGPLSSWRRF